MAEKVSGREGRGTKREREASAEDGADL